MLMHRMCWLIILGIRMLWFWKKGSDLERVCRFPAFPAGILFVCVCISKCHCKCKVAATCVRNLL